MTQTQAPPRIRTYSWSDPKINAVELGRRSGLDVLRAISSGELPPPPIMHTLGYDGLDAREGEVTFMLTPEEFHYNPLGTVHGGVLSTLLDSAAGCAVHSTLPGGYGYTSLDLSVKFLRPVTVDSGRLRCAGSGTQPRAYDRPRRGEDHRRRGSARRPCHVDLPDLRDPHEWAVTLVSPTQSRAEGAIPELLPGRSAVRRCAAAAIRSSEAVKASRTCCSPAGP